MKRLLPLALLFVSAAAYAQLTAPAPQVLVPAAGAVGGLNGTFFRSDIAIYNFRNADQTVALRWLPQGQSGAGTQLVLITIRALSGVISEDFVTDFMHQSGLGAILVSAVNADGSAIDPNGALFVTSRIWSPQPDKPTGTVSQTFPTIDTARINSSNIAILGQRLSDKYRTNVGIVNLSNSQQTFQVLQNSDVESFAPIVETVTVPALSMQQIALPSVIPVTALQVRVSATTAIGAGQWVAYGSTVDNVTGDSWSSLGQTISVSP